MNIRVNIPRLFRHHVDQQAFVTVKGETLGTCLADLLAQYPSLRKRMFDPNDKLLKQFCIYVNKEIVAREEMSKSINDDDEIHITFAQTGC